MAKINNTANLPSLKRVNALRPNVSTNDFRSLVLFTGHSGMKREYALSTNESMPDENSCVYESCMAMPPILSQLVSSMLQMNPTVPKARIGGKLLTVSIPALVSALYATELLMAIVGMKKAMLKAYNVNKGANCMSPCAFMQYAPAAIIKTPASK